MERSSAQALSQETKQSVDLAADYREYAAELREIATLGGGDGLDQELLVLAQEFDLLAEMVEERLNLPTEGACRATQVV